MIALETAIVEELKNGRGRPPKRLYLKFHYFSKEASALLIRIAFRDPGRRHSAPEPDVAAAIVVCDEFRPQPQATLCNCAEAAARELRISKAAGDRLENCVLGGGKDFPAQELRNEG